MFLKIKVLVFALVVLTWCNGYTATRYVKYNATGTNNGKSWKNAYTDLQVAIKAASKGDEIWVAAGTYIPTEFPDPANSTNDRDKAFYWKKDLKIYGGFAGTETLLWQRDVVANPTILSGDRNGDDVGFMNNSENAYHVLITTGLTKSALIDGFTIKGGNANALWSITFSARKYYREHGGGIYNAYSSPTLRNITVTSNSAFFHGGGIYNTYSSPNITNGVVITGNEADYGGGMYSTKSLYKLNINDAVISDNHAYSGGGGIYNDGTSPVIANVSITGNTAVHGGGIYNYSSSPTLENVILSANKAEGGNPANYCYGGGIYNSQSQPFLDNVTITRNSADVGGGVYNVNGGSWLAIVNSSIANNIANAYGGGIANEIGASPILTNVQITGNTAYGGGGMFNYYCSPVLTNVQITGNTAYVGGGIENYNGSSPKLNDVSITNNTAGHVGGAIYNVYLCSDTLTNVVISENTSSDGGGGVFSDYSSSHLTNVVMRGNTSTYGGAFYHRDCSINFINVTMSGNIANTHGGGIYQENGSTNIINSIIWNNEAEEIYNNGFGTTVYANSLIKGSGGSSAWNVGYGTDGGGNIDADPYFYASTDFRLVIGSPALNSGDNNANLTSLDIYGNARVQDTLIDMGAVEGGSMQPVSQRYYVNHIAQGLNNGTSWTDAFNNLQDALHIATKWDEIWVAAGTYKPTHYPDPANTTDPRDMAFYMSSDVKLYGGFGGIETLLSERDPLTNITVLSGDLNGDDITGLVNNSENTYHVLVAHGLSSTTVIDGFTLKGGNANGGNCIAFGRRYFCRDRGGAFLNYFSSPTLTNIVLTENNASYGGGAIYSLHSSPSLANVNITENTASYGGGIYAENLFGGNSFLMRLSDVNILGNNATGNGGGVYTSYYSLGFANATISGNNATGDGGGVYSSYSSPSFAGVTISSNKAAENGGGIYASHSAPSFSNVTIATNIADKSGGGIYASYSSPTISNAILTANTAKYYYGGGVYNDNSSPTLSNVTITDNIAYSGGGGIYNTSSPAVLTDVSVQNNTTAKNGGGVFNSQSSPTLTNVIIRGNVGPDYGGGIYNEYASAPILTNVAIDSNVANVGGGMYNFQASPKLINSTITRNKADFHGGGVYNDYNTILELINVTITGNAADSNGGAIYHDNTSAANIINTILWNNGANEIHSNAPVPVITHYNSLVKGSGGSGLWDNAYGYDGGSNLDTIPLFMGSADLSLKAGSPAIDAGNNAYNTTSIDAAGNSRIQGNAIDMGAYEHAPVAISNHTINPVSCYGGNDGSIDFITYGGGNGYSYSWEDGTNSQNRTGLYAGTYAVTVTGSNGSVTTDSFVIEQPVALAVSALTKNVSCYNGSNGSISLFVSGGNGQYSFAWSDGGDPVPDRVNLANGTYTVTVTDVKSCLTTATAIVDLQPSIINWYANTKVAIANADTLLTKVAGNTNNWDATSQGHDTLRATDDGSIETTVLETNTERILGLKELGVVSNKANVSYGICFEKGGKYRITESNVFATAKKSYKTNDVFSIERNAGTVKYYQNKKVVYTSKKASNTDLQTVAVLKTMGSTLYYVTEMFGCDTAASKPFNAQSISINPVDKAPSNSFIASDIFPNPANQQLNVVLENVATHPVYISVFSTSGQAVEHLFATKSVTQLNTTHWANGLYFIKIESAGRIFLHKIMIQH